MKQTSSSPVYVFDTVVKNANKHNPAKLAEQTTASHVEEHTPVPKAKPVTAPAN